jgi:hypothetical protein
MDCRLCSSTSTIIIVKSEALENNPLQFAKNGKMMFLSLAEDYGYVRKVIEGTEEWHELLYFGVSHEDMRSSYSSVTRQKITKHYVKQFCAKQVMHVNRVLEISLFRCKHALAQLRGRKARGLGPTTRN